MAVETPFNLHHAGELRQARWNTPYIHQTAGPCAVSAAERSRERQLGFSSVTSSETLTKKATLEEKRRPQRDAYAAEALYGPGVTSFDEIHRFPLAPHQKAEPAVRQTGVPRVTVRSRLRAEQVLNVPETVQPAWATLNCSLETPPAPAVSATECERRRLRWESDWINAQLEEDRFVLFGDSTLNTDYPVTGAAALPQGPLRTRACLERWATVKQERYFWDFVNCYDTTRKSQKLSAPEPHKCDEDATKGLTDAQVKRQRYLTETHFAEERMRRRKEKDPRIVTVIRPHEFLPSIFPPDPQRHIKRPKKKRVVSFHNLSAAGLEIAQITCCPPFHVDFRRWCTNTLHPPFERPPNVQRLMSYFDAQVVPVYPPGTKSFEDTYPSLPKEVLEKIQREKEAQERLTKGRGPEGLETYLAPMEKREARKVGGGRYALR